MHAGSVCVCVGGGGGGAQLVWHLLHLDLSEDKGVRVLRIFSICNNSPAMDTACR